MAWGISPRKTVVVPLGDYSADYYLTLSYYAMQNMGWHISYYNHDGIIAYTNISWPSYSEEVSIRIIKGKAHIKSECVGYQGWFTDYGKNQANLDLFFGELEFHDAYFKDNIAATSQELMDSIPENQFVQLDNPPMVGKELLRSFPDWFTPRKNYFVTPILVLINIAIYIITMFAMAVIVGGISKSHRFDTDYLTEAYEQAYLILGFSGRSQIIHGEVWRLVTSAFLHFGLGHLFGNMIILIYIGSMIEPKLGKWTFLILYLCTGIVASMVSASWRDDGIGAGASGAIFGLFGILLALLSTDFYERSARRALFISTAIFVGYSIIPKGHQIDNAAHIGGLISGYVFGLIAYLGIKRDRHETAGYTAALASVVLMVIFVIFSIGFATDYKVKEFKQLVEESRTITTNINGYFYNSVNMEHDDRVKQLKSDALPLIKHFAGLADQLTALPLPKKDKIDATYRAKIIKLQCKYFNLLYLEFRDHTDKYRPAINAATDSINNVRMKWGEAKDN